MRNTNRYTNYFGDGESSLEFKNQQSLVEKKASAQKRLLKDWAEIQTNPLPTICAHPLEHNLFEWHVNLMAPKGTDYEGAIYHLEMHFSEYYPMRPPKVFLCTTIPRSAVFGNELCLDMLEAHHFSEAPYSGWSTGYTVLSILLQLQVFLFEADEYYDRSTAIVESIAASKKFRCATCGHHVESGNIWPCSPLWLSEKHTKSVPHRMKEEKEDEYCGIPIAQFEKLKKKEQDRFFKLRDQFKQQGIKMDARIEKRSGNYCLRIKKFEVKQLDKQGQTQSYSSTAKPELKPVESYSTTAKPDLKPVESYPILSTDSPASLSRVPMEIIAEILTYLDIHGVRNCSKVCKTWRRASQYAYVEVALERETICFHSKASYKEDILGIGINLQINPRTSLIQYVQSPLDLLSWTSFDKVGVRASMWREKFTHWLPLYINRSHGKRSLPIFKQLITTMFNRDQFTPELALDLLPKLMNTMVVNIMNGQLHASVKALEGYLQCLRLLIAIVQEYPGLKAKIDARISQFKKYEKCRHKNVEPSLGDFLPLIPVSSYSWYSVAYPVLSETLDRNALWIVKKYPELNMPFNKPKVESTRLEKSWDATQVSMRLIMFHIYFLRHVAKPTAAVSGVSAMDQLASELDARYGKPTPQMLENLQQEVKKIQSINSFDTMFSYAGFIVDGPNFSTTRLKEAMQHSIQKGYHSMHSPTYNKA